MTEEQQHVDEEEHVRLPDEVTPYKYDITSYGADYPVDSLVARLKRGDIYVPSFQRNYVWSIRRASRFVESLLLGLPVPGIFLSRDEETQRLLVIDGQQRLRTLQFFFDNEFMGRRPFRLLEVQAEFQGVTYATLPDGDRRRLDDSIIHVTIMRQEKPSEDNSSILYVFERLNTGGVRLSSQEIRGCIYHGPFDDLLQQLNCSKLWRDVFGPINRRKRDEELILRFLTLYHDGHKYKKPMKTFLNGFMGKNRRLQTHSADQLTVLFGRAIRVVHWLGRKAFRPWVRLNAAAAEAVMVGVAKRLDRGSVEHSPALRQQLDRLFSDQSFLQACLTATTDEESVARRLKAAIAAFADVQ